MKQLATKDEMETTPEAEYEGCEPDFWEIKEKEYHERLLNNE